MSIKVIQTPVNYCRWVNKDESTDPRIGDRLKTPRTSIKDNRQHVENVHDGKASQADWLKVNPIEDRLFFPELQVDFIQRNKHQE